MSKSNLMTLEGLSYNDLDILMRILNRNNINVKDCNIYCYINYDQLVYGVKFEVKEIDYCVWHKDTPAICIVHNFTSLNSYCGNIPVCKKCNDNINKSLERTWINKEIKT
jgi:hypothetical protein